MMIWHKLGRVLSCDDYAQTPTPLVFDDFVRVYYASRTPDNKAFIRYVDLDAENPMRIIENSVGQVLEPGDPCSFDADGQMPSYAMRSGENVNLYYSGWSALASGGYQNSIGAALSRDSGKTFVRAFDGPLMDRTPIEPYLCVTPCMVGDGRMFYISGLRWEEIDGRKEPIYGVCQARSVDGLNWMRDGKLVIPQAHPRECFSRPWYFKRGADYFLFYCYRSAIDYRDGEGAYRIGRAVSSDGFNWGRCDVDAGIDVSPGEWDSTMLAYPAIFEAKGRTYMLYNGNSFGKHGFGLAVLQ